jgi:hypothetical protein
MAPEKLMALPFITLGYHANKDRREQRLYIGLRT